MACHWPARRGRQLSVREHIELGWICNVGSEMKVRRVPLPFLPTAVHSRGRTSTASSCRPMDAFCSAEVARGPHGRNWSRLDRSREPRSGTDRRPEQRDRYFGVSAWIRTGDLVVFRISLERSPARLCRCGAVKAATVLSTRGRDVSPQSTQILPTFCDSQIPATCFS
jgi:hypothetical protein